MKEFRWSIGETKLGQRVRSKIWELYILNKSQWPCWNHTEIAMIASIADSLPPSEALMSSSLNTYRHAAYWIESSTLFGILSSILKCISPFSSFHLAYLAAFFFNTNGKRSSLFFKAAFRGQNLLVKCIFDVNMYVPALVSRGDTRWAPYGPLLVTKDKL